MRRLIIASGLAIVCGSAALMLLATPRAGARQARAASAGAIPEPAPLPADCMPSSEVRPGMIGIGRTVFQGFKPGEFKAEILGVQRSAMAHGNMIVARLSGPLLEQHGVVAGMSGSPVFVNGKTIGAVAYGWSFAYKPYCGITPIEQMWTVWNAIGRKGLTQADEAAGNAALLGLTPGMADAGEPNAPWNWQKEWQAYKDRIDGKAEPLASPLAWRPDLPELKGVPGELKPLASPLFVGGVSARTEARMRQWFAADGLDVMGAGSLLGSDPGASGNSDIDHNAPPREPAPPLEDGSGVGIPLVTGDMSLGAIGTVTYRRGDKLIAFGHPMFQRGPMCAPMSATYIFGFMQSYERSFKLGETRDEVGVVDQDRLFAIGGQFGPRAPRVQAEVTVGGDAAFRARTYHYNIWNDEKLLPMLLMNLTGEAFSSSVAQGGKLTAHSDYKITLADGRALQKSYFDSDEGTGAVDEAASSMLFDLFLLLNNPFAKGAVSNVAMHIDVQPGLRNDDLVDLTPERSQYEPGELVRLHGRFRPYRGEEYQRTFEFNLPRDLEPDTYVVHLTDAAGTQRVRRAHEPATFNPRNFDEVVKLAQAGAPETNALHLWLFRPSADVSVDGQSMAGAPASMSAIINATAPDDRTDAPIGQLVLDQTYSIPAPVDGTETVQLQVVPHINQ